MKLQTGSVDRAGSVPTAHTTRGTVRPEGTSCQAMVAVAWVVSWLGTSAVFDGAASSLPSNQRPERVWFATGFDRPEDFQDPEWQGKLVRGEGRGGGGSLQVYCASSDSPPGSKVITRTLPVDAARGCLVRATAWVQAEEVSERPRPWNGIKFMLAIETPRQRMWPQADMPVGTFAWQRAAFTTRIPSDAKTIQLVLGLESVTGRVWFDDVRLVVAAEPRLAPTNRSDRPFRGHPLARLRGAMVSPDLDPEGLRVLGQEWGANLVRWQLVQQAAPRHRPPLESYESWLEQALRKLDAALPWCERYGLYVVVDLHSPPGGRAIAGHYVASNDRLFSDPQAQAKLISAWQQIAQRYRGSKVIWGFDLVNEPVEEFVEEGCDDWPALAERVARAIQAVDPDRTLIVEPAQWGGPAEFVDWVPLPLSNVVYSVHMYEPHRFTHQGVYDNDPPVRYPGVINGEWWDSTRLAETLRPVREFQQRYRVHIYVGEFSAIRWAPDGSARRYLRDLVELFEAWGWDWTYHAFREWHGWSVEHGEDRVQTEPLTPPTDRQQWLRSWFARNEKPPWWQLPRGSGPEPRDP